MTASERYETHDELEDEFGEAGAGGQVKRGAVGGLVGIELLARVGGARLVDVHALGKQGYIGGRGERGLAVGVAAVVDVEVDLPEDIDERVGGRADGELVRRVALCGTGADQGGEELVGEVRGDALHVRGLLVDEGVDEGVKGRVERERVDRVLGRLACEGNEPFGPVRARPPSQSGPCATAGRAGTDKGGPPCSKSTSSCLASETIWATSIPGRVSE